MTPADVCETPRNAWGDALTLFLIIGTILSYTPQHYKIINKGSSEGISPWFLLLGATSSAAGALNIWTMQWGVVRCCKYLSAATCLESLGGAFQVSTQWLMFVVIEALFIVYYPTHLKYGTEPVAGKPRKRTTHWALSIFLGWVIFAHFAICAAISLYLVLRTPSDLPAGPAAHSPRIAAWATFLGLTSAVLAAVQYCPQLYDTFSTRLVGALSIPMMFIQSPGSALMVVSIAMKPGTDWTSWIMFAVSGFMQAFLLVMCICWKVRQRRLNIDDFGHPLTTEETNVNDPAEIASVDEGECLPPVPDEEIVRAMMGEDTPLLKKGRRRELSRQGSGSGSASGAKIKKWLQGLRR